MRAAAALLLILGSLTGAPLAAADTAEDLFGGLLNAGDPCRPICMPTGYGQNGGNDPNAPPGPHGPP